MNRTIIFKLCTLFSIFFTQNFFAAESLPFRKRLIGICCCSTCCKNSNSTERLPSNETKIDSRILPSQQTMLIIPSIAIPKDTTFPISPTPIVINIGNANSAFQPFTKVKNLTIPQ